MRAILPLFIRQDEAASLRGEEEEEGPADGGTEEGGAEGFDGRVGDLEEGREGGRKGGRDGEKVE